MPVLPLDYHIPVKKSAQGRPGMWVALGISSILLGLVSLVLNSWLAALWFDIASKSWPPAVQPYTLTNSTLAPLPGEYIGPRGLDRQTRRASIPRFPISDPSRSPDCSAMLDRLLAECGQDVLGPKGQQTPTPAGITTVKRPGVIKDDQRYVFRVPGGVVELGTTGALYLSSTQTTAVYHTTAATYQGSLTNSATRRYAVFTINESLDALRKSGTPLTPAQAATVADILSKLSADALHAPSAWRPQVEPQTIGLAGVLTIRLDRTPWVILADGRSYIDAPGIVVDPVSGRVTPPISGSFLPQLPGSPGLMYAQAFHCVAGAILASILIIAGARLAAGKIGGASLHLWWAMAKVAMAVVEFALVTLYVQSIQHGQRSKDPFDIDRGVTSAGISVAIQLVYPAIVVLVLRSGRSKSYIASEGGLRSLLSKDVRRRSIAWLAGSRYAPWVRWSSVALFSLVLLHLVASVGRAQQAEWNPMARHLVVMAAAGGLAVYLIRFGSKPVVAAILLLAIVCVPATAQTRPTRPRPTPKPATVPAPKPTASLLELLQHPNPQVRLQARPTALNRSDPQQVAAVMRLVFDPLDGVDPRLVRQNTDLEIRYKAAQLLILGQPPDPEGVAAVLTSDKAPTSAERNKILDAFVATCTGLRAMRNATRPLPEWDAVRQVVAAELSRRENDSSRYVKLFQSGDALQQRLALSVLEALAPPVPVSIDTILPNLDLKDVRTRNLTVALIGRDLDHTTSPQAMALFADALRAGNSSATDSLERWLGKAGRPTRRFIDLASELGMPSRVQWLVFEAALPPLSRGNPERDSFTQLITNALMRSNVRTPDRAAAAADVLKAMKQTDKPVDAFFQVLRSGSDASRRSLAEVVLADDTRESFGPTVQEEAMRLLNRFDPPITAARQVTPAGHKDTQSDLADVLGTIAWTASLVVLVLLVSTAAVALNVGARITGR